MSATQHLRDLIADMAWGGTSSTMLHNELMAVEVALGLPLTLQNPWGAATPEQIKGYEAVQAAEARQQEGDE